MGVYWHIISCDLRCSVNRCTVSGCIFKRTKQLFSPCPRNRSGELQSFAVILRDRQQRIFRGYIAPGEIENWYGLPRRFDGRLLQQFVDCSDARGRSVVGVFEGRGWRGSTGFGGLNRHRRVLCSSPTTTGYSAGGLVVGADVERAVAASAAVFIVVLAAKGPLLFQESRNKHDILRSAKTTALCVVYILLSLAKPKDNSRTLHKNNHQPPPPVLTTSTRSNSTSTGLS